MSSSSAWLILILAGVMEVGMALGLKYAVGFTKLWPSVAAVVFGAVSMYLLSVSLRVLPAGVGYAAWTGIGAVGVLVVGMVFLKEPFNLLRLVCVLLIIAGVAGLHASTVQR
ncbi:MAG: multidrug efflux SMR transporter [Phycisphaerales bacterium]|nr:multidrug efflux SMR transporter [Phycisphaerales bacterium]